VLEFFAVSEVSKSLRSDGRVMLIEESAKIGY